MANYPGHLIRLINSYMRDRSFPVRVTTLSNNVTVNADVPQGSVLEPKLCQPCSQMILVFAHSSSAIGIAEQIQVHVSILERYFEN